LGAIEEYIDKFPVTVGFSIEEAKSAEYVTILGGAGGVPAKAERILQVAGCKVERLAGATEAETRQMLDQLAAQGRRFAKLQ
jgi:putative cell wall-binding protein